MKTVHSSRLQSTSSLRLRVLTALTGAAVGVVGCDTTREATDIALPPVEGTTLIGTPLQEPNWNSTARARLVQDLAIAQAVFDVAPEREDSFIWLGRRSGYLGRYRRAIDVFTRGLEVHPESYKLYRFRGRHRARNREFQAALDDYRRAGELIEGHEDSFEPDGIPNARNQTLGTYKSNIDYYLAQTSWAVGDYETVVSGMERSLTHPLGSTPDRLVSAAFWRYLGHRKLGQHQAARDVVRDVAPDLEMIENFTYYRSVLFFRDNLTREEVLDGSDDLVKFAVAMHDSFEGESERAEQLLLDLVRNAALGFWPAEVELVALGHGVR